MTARAVAAPGIVEERESARLLALHRASTALGSATADSGHVVAEILRNATNLLDADGAMLYQWDPTIDKLRCVRSWRHRSFARE